MPPPSTLAQFDQVVPGSAERIVRMAEMEQEHRHQAEKEMLAVDKAIVKRGHLLGFIASITAILAAVLSAYLGAHWSVSIAIVSLPVTALIKELFMRR